MSGRNYRSRDSNIRLHQAVTKASQPWCLLAERRKRATQMNRVRSLAGMVAVLAVLVSTALASEAEVQTSVDFCVGASSVVSQLKACVDDKGTVSVTGGAVGVQGTSYWNPATGNHGACVGVGGEVRAGTFGVGGSVETCKDNQQGLTSRTSVNAGPVQATWTQKAQDHIDGYKPVVKETRSDWKLDPNQLLKQTGR
jgi:hypothetical protein